jgi:hypothetical protein
MANKRSLFRRNSIQVSISGEVFDKVWEVLESMDKADLNVSSEIWRMMLAANKYEDLKEELRRGYPNDYMTDEQLSTPSSTAKGLRK